jgi:hypothetical protein
MGKFNFWWGNFRLGKGKSYLFCLGMTPYFSVCYIRKKKPGNLLLNVVYVTLAALFVMNGYTFVLEQPQTHNYQIKPTCPNIGMPYR